MLDGEIACPPEDSNGLDGMGIQPYQKFMDKVLAAKAETSSKHQRKCRELCASAAGLNYKERYVGRLAAGLDCQCLPACRARLCF